MHRFLNIFCAEADTFIKCPTQDNTTGIENEFKSVAGFPEVFGAIDGNHIEIWAPRDRKLTALIETIGTTLHL